MPKAAVIAKIECKRIFMILQKCTKSMFIHLSHLRRWSLFIQFLLSSIKYKNFHWFRSISMYLQQFKKKGPLKNDFMSFKKRVFHWLVKQWKKVIIQYNNLLPIINIKKISILINYRTSMTHPFFFFLFLFENAKLAL